MVRTNEKRRFRLIRDPATLPTTSSSLSSSLLPPPPPSSTSAADAAATAAASSAAEQAPTTALAADEDASADAATETDIGDVDDPDPDPAHFLIRAAQGHSLAIEQETGLYTPLTPETAPPAVVHGTYRKAWPLILRSGGLKRMGRTHIHFAPAELPPAAAAAAAAYSNNDNNSSSSSSSSSGSVDDAARPPPPPPPPPPLLPPAPTQPDQAGQPRSSSSNPSGKSAAPADKAVVVSGMRASAEISVYVDVRAAMRRAPAVRWWRAGNGVVLTAGDPATGVLASELFSLAVLKADGRVLWQHGKPVHSL